MSLVARIRAAAAHVQAPQNVMTAAGDSRLSRCRLCIREGGHRLEPFLARCDQLLYGIKCKKASLKIAFPVGTDGICHQWSVRLTEVASRYLRGSTGMDKVEQLTYRRGGQILRRDVKIYFKRVYSEVTFAIGSEFIMHALEDSEPIADLRRNKKRIPYCQETWAALDIVVLRADESGRNRRSLRKPSDQWHHPARFPLELPYREIEDMILFAGDIAGVIPDECVLFFLPVAASGRSNFHILLSPVPGGSDGRDTSAGMKKLGKREIPEKKRRPAASLDTIPTCGNGGVTRPGNEPGSPWYDYSVFISAPSLIGCARLKGLVSDRLLRAVPDSLSAGFVTRKRLDCSPPRLGTPGYIPGGVAPRFSRVRIVPGDAVGRHVFSGISRFPPPFHSAAAPRTEIVSGSLQVVFHAILLVEPIDVARIHACILLRNEISWAWQWNLLSAYTRQKAKSKYRNRIRLEIASQKQCSDDLKTPYDRVKRCRERNVNVKSSERVDVDVFKQNKRPCPQHCHAPFFRISVRIEVLRYSGCIGYSRANGSFGSAIYFYGCGTSSAFDFYGCGTSSAIDFYGCGTSSAFDFYGCGTSSVFDFYGCGTSSSIDFYGCGTSSAIEFFEWHSYGSIVVDFFG
ncbi:hypothetical protein PR048_024494 [Dryococelus australis]|uniref:Uncharacterized protein n=1 Tax=Dryococelus australis TaxID=614101 RepID=A0ABQ9GNR6_9NEOP|nr:hypothetical protein PR048_024494 [Dryococelus australis]